jgi:hypothetical protein
MARTAEDLLGNKSSRAVIEYLREIGDDEAADALAPPGGTGQMLGFSWGNEVWGYTGMLIGFIPAEGTGQRTPIDNAYTIAADPTLKGSRTKITLERFWVERYPGRGTHKILCEFTGKNQAQGEQEELKLAVKTEANDKSSAGIGGTPIFLGVTVGNNGIQFEGTMINVSSKKDTELLAALSSGPFREGLGLLTTAQPALKPFVGLTTSVVNAVLKRSENKEVYRFKLGLDFETSQTSVALRHGSFVVVQGDDHQWDWSTLAWNVDAQQIVDRETGEPINLNYLVFRVAPFHD